MDRKSWARTDPGRKRPNNEDALFRDDDLGLYVVADGVGGAAAGEEASQTAVRVIAHGGPRLRRLVEAYDREPDAENARRAVFDALQDAIERANNEVFASARSDVKLKGMMTTLTVVLMSRSAAFVGHVGDSRLYLVREGVLEQVTTDHTLAEMMVQAGRITRDEVETFAFSNVLARAVGEKPSVEIDLLYVDLMPEDTLLMCSDGLTGYAALDDIRRTLEVERPDDPAARLVRLANAGGGGDNITVVVAQLHAAHDELVTCITQLQPMGHTVKADFLKNLFFCRHLSQEERVKLLRYVHEVRAAASDIVVRQGDDGQDLFVVVEGQLEVLVGGVVVTQIESGGHFGEIALVRGEKRSATVRACGDVRLFRLSRDGFYDLGRKDQGIAVKMLWAFAQTLAGRVMTLSEDLVEARKGHR